MLEQFGRLRSQADNRRQRMLASGELSVMDFNKSSMMDPKWDAWLEALQDQGVTELADSSVGAAKGMFSATPQTSTFDPSFQTSAGAGMSPSRQIGQRLPGKNAALRGLQQASGYESHEGFMKRHGRQ